MAHYSEMDFLFGTNNISSKVFNNENVSSVFTRNIVIYRYKDVSGTDKIKNYLKDGAGAGARSGGVYKNSTKNPYVQLLTDFSITSGEGAGLTLMASDFAYLRDLGVYPINRMAILRRFPEGVFVPENLEEMKIPPISTIVGWLKPDQHFGQISFHETWEKTQDRFDVLLAKIIKKSTGITVDKLFPVADYTQGILFELYKKLNLITSGEEKFSGLSNFATQAAKSQSQEDAMNWGLNNIPVGDPNVLQEGPFRNPECQNIRSDFTFDLETTYEQKLIGDVDPGSAMLDILENMFTMGTSNMVFYWGENAPAIIRARAAATEKANELDSWWIFVKNIMSDLWKTITDLFSIENLKKIKTDVMQLVSSVVSGDKAAESDLQKVLQSILTTTISIQRFNIRGSLELMVGGRMSSTPWYLTLGNPYSPWLATNHIIVKSATVETSTEMGFNDQPQWLKVKFTCEFSRALGKQELMRMFNNSYRRSYGNLPRSNTPMTSLNSKLPGPIPLDYSPPQLAKSSKNQGKVEPSSNEQDMQTGTLEEAANQISNIAQNGKTFFSKLKTGVKNIINDVSEIPGH